MRIHRLVLRNVKGVADREVIFPERGVVVLEGPNEIGKTTMLEAVDVLLEEKDSSRKRHVLGLRPVGRDVPTTIEAELSSGPYRFHYRKQWFRQPATELRVSAPRIEQLSGVAAHERVTQIVAETTDATLWKALRLLQAAPLTQADLGGSAALAAALDVSAATGGPTTGDAPASAAGAAFGSAVGSPGTGEGPPGTGDAPDELLAAVEAERARYFTAGRSQPTGDYRAALEAVDRAAAAERRATEAVGEVESDVAAHAVVAAEAGRAVVALAAARAEAEALATRAADAAALEAARQAAHREAEAAERDLARARERAQERARLVADLAERDAAVAAHEVAVADLTAELGPDEERLAAAATRRTTAGAAVAGLAEAVRAAEVAQEARQTAETARRLAERLTHAETIDAERRAIAGDLAGLKIDDKAVRRLERAATALELAASQAAADSGRVTIVALADGQSLVVDGMETDLAAGESLDRALEEDLEIILPGRLAVRLRPESGAAARRAGVAAARRELTEALAAAGVRDLAEATERLDRRRAGEDRLARAADRLADVLAGTSLDELRDEVAAAQARAGHDAPRDEVRRDEVRRDEVRRDEAAAAGAAGGAADPAGGDAVWDPGGEATPERDLPGLRADLRTAQEELAELTARHEALRAAVESARVARTRAESLLAAARTELTAARDRLARLRETDPDETLTGAVATAERIRDEARARLTATVTELADLDPDVLAVHRDAAAAAARAAADRSAALRDQRLAIEARLEQSGRQGRYDALEAARGDLEHAQRRLTSVRRRAEAARRLHDTLQAHRAATQARYVAPFAGAIGRLGRVVYGPGLQVEVGEDLAIQARVLDGERIEYEALSSGAKEQLAILTRLAVATLVDPRQGVPVVIDDALGYSDPDRLRRMTAAFSLLGDQAQVILLTCTPGRYDGIVGAQVIRLGEPREPAPVQAVS